MAKKPNGFWIYAIEINPEWIPHLPRCKVPRNTQRLIYVGFTGSRPREGGLADKLNATPGTLAWSNMGKAAEARKAASAARKRKKARRQRRKARKAAEDAG